MRYLLILPLLCLLANVVSAQNTVLIGRVWADNDNNCQFSGSDRIMSEIIVEARDSFTGSTYYAATSIQNSGYYEFFIPPGIYIIKANLPFDFPYQSYCQNGVPLFLISGQTDTFDFYAQRLLGCAKMKVEIGSSGLPDCGTGKYWMSYENIGTSTAFNVLIDLQLDSLMVLDTASIPYTNIGNGIYRFNAGTVGVGRDSAIVEMLGVSYCAAIPGQTFCAKLSATAQNSCPDPWQGPVIEVNAEVVGDSILFTARNIGPSNMLQVPRTRVIIDDVMYSPPVPALDTTTPYSFAVFAEDKMYRFEADQDSTMPKISAGPQAWAAKENGNFKPGSYTQYFTDNTDPSIAFDCQETVSILTYNSKSTQTKGYESQRYISNRIPLEYQIRFQNLSPNLAQSIEIIDTLPEYLDVNTLIMGATSHGNYILKLFGERVLSISFPSIMLPSQLQSSDNSIGFINFFIDQKADAPLGGVIENRALIVVNYLDTIRTATAYNTIGEDFILLLSAETVFDENAQVNIYPNPASSFLNIKVEGIEFSKMEFVLTDIAGRTVYESDAAASPMQLELPALENSLYFYRILANGRTVDVGKLVILK